MARRFSYLIIAFGFAHLHVFNISAAFKGAGEFYKKIQTLEAEKKGLSFEKPEEAARRTAIDAEKNRLFDEELNKIADEFKFDVQGQTEARSRLVREFNYAVANAAVKNAPLAANSEVRLAATELQKTEQKLLEQVEKNNLILSSEVANPLAPIFEQAGTVLVATERLVQPTLTSFVFETEAEFLTKITKQQASIDELLNIIKTQATVLPALDELQNALFVMKTTLAEVKNFKDTFKKREEKGDALLLAYKSFEAVVKEAFNTILELLPEINADPQISRATKESLFKFLQSIDSAVSSVDLLKAVSEQTDNTNVLDRFSLQDLNDFQEGIEIKIDELAEKINQDAQLPTIKNMTPADAVALVRALQETSQVALSTYEKIASKALSADELVSEIAFAQENIESFMELQQAVQSFIEAHSDSILDETVGKANKKILSDMLSADQLLEACIRTNEETLNKLYSLFEERQASLPAQPADLALQPPLAVKETTAGLVVESDDSALKTELLSKNYEKSPFENYSQALLTESGLMPQAKVELAVRITDEVVKNIKAAIPIFLTAPIAKPLRSFVTRVAAYARRAEPVFDVIIKVTPEPLRKPLIVAVRELKRAAETVQRIERAVQEAPLIAQKSSNNTIVLARVEGASLQSIDAGAQAILVKDQLISKGSLYTSIKAASSKQKELEISLKAFVEKASTVASLLKTNNAQLLQAQLSVIDQSINSVTKNFAAGEEAWNALAGDLLRNSFVVLYKLAYESRPGGAVNQAQVAEVETLLKQAMSKLVVADEKAIALATQRFVTLASAHLYAVATASFGAITPFAAVSAIPSDKSAAAVLKYVLDKATDTKEHLTKLWEETKEGAEALKTAAENSYKAFDTFIKSKTQTENQINQADVAQAEALLAPQTVESANYSLERVVSMRKEAQKSLGAAKAQIIKDYWTYKLREIDVFEAYLKLKQYTLSIKENNPKQFAWLNDETARPDATKASEADKKELEEVIYAEVKIKKLNEAVVSAQATLDAFRLQLARAYPDLALKLKPQTTLEWARLKVQDLFWSTRSLIAHRFGTPEQVALLKQKSVELYNAADQVQQLAKKIKNNPTFLQSVDAKNRFMVTVKLLDSFKQGVLNQKLSQEQFADLMSRLVQDVILMYRSGLITSKELSQDATFKSVNAQFTSQLLQFQTVIKQFIADLAKFDDAQSQELKQLYQTQMQQLDGFLTEISKFD